MVTRTTTGWRKSTFCNSGGCVEVAFDGDVVAVRDSKDPKLAAMRFTLAQWADFVSGVKNNEFDRV